MQADGQRLCQRSVQRVKPIRHTVQQIYREHNVPGHNALCMDAGHMDVRAVVEAAYRAHVAFSAWDIGFHRNAVANLQAAIIFADLFNHADALMADPIDRVANRGVYAFICR